MRTDERELLELGERIARASHPSASPALRAQIHASLMSAPIVTFAPAPRGWLARLRPVLVAATIVAVALAGTGYAAAGSIAGDPLFAVKQAAEGVELASAPNEAARLRTLVAQSDRRLAELQVAVATRPAAAEAAAEALENAAKKVQAALSRVLAAPSNGKRDEAVKEAEHASQTHLELLEELKDKLPAAAQPGIERAIEVQRDVNEKSGEGPGPRTSPRPERTREPERTPTGAPAIAPRTPEPARTPEPTKTATPAPTPRAPEPTRTATPAPTR